MPKFANPQKILLYVLFQMKYKLMNEELFILRSRDTIFVFKSAYEPNSEIQTDMFIDIK